MTIRQNLQFCLVMIMNVEKVQANVPQSTISTWLRQRHDGTLLSAGTVRTKTAIPLLVENDLVDIIIFLSDCGQNMDRDAVRILAKSFLDHMRWKVTNFKDNRPGLD